MCMITYPPPSPASAAGSRTPTAASLRSADEGERCASQCAEKVPVPAAQPAVAVRHDANDHHHPPQPHIVLTMPFLHKLNANSAVVTPLQAGVPLSASPADADAAADDGGFHDDAMAAVQPLIAPPVPKAPLQPNGNKGKNARSFPGNYEPYTYPPLAALKARPSSRGCFAREAQSILALALPMVLTGLLLYSRSMVSMLFLGRLGELALAGGALAVGFANITGYSVLSGLAMGMEPICGQAFGARRPEQLGLALQRTVLLLLTASIPIAALWLSMRRILLFCGQDPEISAVAHEYILYSLPDLMLQSILHPLRIYLRSQSITMPLTYCAVFAMALHFPINYLLVSVFHLGIEGVALASVLANLNLVAALVLYVHCFSGVSKKTGGGLRFSMESLKGWSTLLNLAIPSCVSVCLEWWWYEIMILLCGLLANPKATVASMGILIQITSLVYIFPSSLSFGVSTRVSNELGANRPDRASKAAEVGLSLGLLLGVAALGFNFSVSKFWASMFTADTDILRLTAAALPIIGLCELGNCPQTTGCGVLRGSARPKTAANINLASFYAVGTPVAVGLGFWAGVDFVGLWCGLLAAQGACSFAMLYVIRKTDWELQAARAQKLTGGAAEPAVEDREKVQHDFDFDSEVDILVVKLEKAVAANTQVGVGGGGYQGSHPERQTVEGGQSLLASIKIEAPPQ